MSFEAQIVQEYPKYKPAMLDGFSDKDTTTSHNFAAAWAARGGSELWDNERWDTFDRLNLVILESL